MPPKSPSPILRLLRRTLEDRRVRDLPDGELLRRFASGRDEAAFDGLLRRHGPMVLDVCRNVLGREADAEDAFQATFLVFAQKAGAIRKRASVGSWLYGVAYRTALKARTTSARRSRLEICNPKPAAVESSDDLSWREVRQVLHAELQRFSDCYRAPLVLCYLEGRSQDEAARLLGVSPAALKKRLERARTLLRSRLVRRGFGPAALLAAAAWPAASAPACLPPALFSSTMQIATEFVAGHAAAGIVSAEVAALTEGVSKAMFLTKLRVVTAVALAFVAVPLAGGVAVRIHAASGRVAVADIPAGQNQDRRPATQGRGAAKAAEAKGEQAKLSGVWLKTWSSAQGRLNFEVLDPPPPPADKAEFKAVGIRWTPPPEMGELARDFSAWYKLTDRAGEKLIVFDVHGQRVETSYKLDGDTLTFDGGILLFDRPGNGSDYLGFELKGEWKRVDTDLESKFHRAFPGLDIMANFRHKIESGSQRLLIAFNEAVVLEDGRFRLNDCAIAFMPDDQPGVKLAIPTAIRCEYAIVTTDKPMRTIRDLGSSTITAVEFADGVRLSLKEK